MSASQTKKVSTSTWQCSFQNKKSFSTVYRFELDQNLKPDPNYMLNENRETSGMFALCCVAFGMLAIITPNLKEEITKKDNIFIKIKYNYIYLE